MIRMLVGERQRPRVLDALVARYSVIHTEPDEVPTVVAEFARVLRPGFHGFGV
jgi:hypothetical protein